MRESDVVCILMRDGKEVQRIEGPCGHSIVVPVAAPMVGSINDLRYSPPAYVLMDRYNSDYEHWWAEEEHRRDIYETAGVVRNEANEITAVKYEYARTEKYKTRNYHRINPDLVPK